MHATSPASIPPQGGPEARLRLCRPPTWFPKRHLGSPRYSISGRGAQTWPLPPPCHCPWKPPLVLPERGYLAVGL